ncbi:phosphate ABC transporter ATP-binding protein [Anaerolineales bacterium HSG6]|nr:phosphate ABC transporter ATP-binding protein [Anaerolineales bacterium HSG6]
MILSNITLTIPAGKITSLIGPSGSGKSSLLRCLNRLWEPPPDTIFIDEVELTSLDVLALRRRVGLVLQQAALFEGTVVDNIRYGPALQQQYLSDERVAELLEMVNLESTFADKSSLTLSGGEAQRVSIARTLANQPEVLLLDEPTSALDPAATRIVEETILRLRTQLGLTVVWVSHTLPQVERVADYMVLLVDGEVVETGVPTHLLSGEHPHLTESFAAGELVSKREVT